MKDEDITLKTKRMLLSFISSFIISCHSVLQFFENDKLFVWYF